MHAIVASCPQGQRSQTGAVGNPPALEALLKRSEIIFKQELGKMKDIKDKVRVREDAKAKFFKPRPVPYALKERIELELERLTSIGVIESITHSEWAAPIVPVIKSSGDVKICGDFKVTVNQCLDIEQYPLPRIEDLYAKLQGGQKFTTLDMAEAFLQIELDEESLQYMVVNTHKGLFRYKRLPFGVSSASAIFQRAMDTILQGLSGVVYYQDDVLVTGSNTKEHIKNLEHVFDRMTTFGLRLRLAKCKFLRETVEYLGHVISSQGIHTSPKKVEVIKMASTPRNITELRSFLGIVNYYGKFIAGLANICAQLNELLRKATIWRWTKECEDSFNKLKQELSSAGVLCHYNPSEQISLACDASAQGLGDVLSHHFKDGSEWPIRFASRTLSKAEQNYSQIEKEALSIIFGLKKFHQYLFGRKFILITDHQPLVKIFGPKTGISSVIAGRLQRWAIYLAGYQYDIVYKSTLQHGNADGLSRYPLAGLKQPEAEDENMDDERILAFQEPQLAGYPLSVEDVERGTMSDALLREVLEFTRNGWKDKETKRDDQLRPYFSRRDELTIEGNCLMWGIRVVIPPQMRGFVLKELHQSHPGIVRMKSLARLYVWWPGIDREIEQMVRGCESCNLQRDNVPLAPLHPWEYPSRPWQRLHIEGCMAYVTSQCHVTIYIATFLYWGQASMARQ